MRPKNAKLSEEEKQKSNSSALCNTFLDECNRCCLCEFPLEANVLNDVEKLLGIVCDWTLYCVKNTNF